MFIISQKSSDLISNIIFFVHLKLEMFSDFMSKKSELAEALTETEALALIDAHLYFEDLMTMQNFNRDLE